LSWLEYSKIRGVGFYPPWHHDQYWSTLDLLLISQSSALRPKWTPEVRWLEPYDNHQRSTSETRSDGVFESCKTPNSTLCATL